jgi:phosphopentomutase
MARAFLVVMDSVGIGGAPDAGQYFNGDLPDLGANTLAHIAQACAAGLAEEGRSGPLRLPTLDALGLGAAVAQASAVPCPDLGAGKRAPMGRWGAAVEQSRGKDTPSGHWELAGLPVPWDWCYFLTRRLPFQTIWSRMSAMRPEPMRSLAIVTLRAPRSSPNTAQRI